MIEVTVDELLHTKPEDLVACRDIFLRSIIASRFYLFNLLFKPFFISCEFKPAPVIEINRIQVLQGENIPAFLRGIPSDPKTSR